jgi:hypothetical protein
MSITKIGAVTEKAKLRVASGESIITMVSVIKVSYLQLEGCFTFCGCFIGSRHTREGGYPALDFVIYSKNWILAFARMTIPYEPVFPFYR